MHAQWIDDETVQAQWQKLGFSSDNPAADFSGAGVFGLHCMLYLAARRRKLFLDIVRRGRAYPFAQGSCARVLPFCVMCAHAFIHQPALHAPSCMWLQCACILSA
ncbi:hypothetical protein EON66_00675 [archaeon]|nr:MAG: hypothetical protein EON66_00675 [archaeon]